MALIWYSILFAASCALHAVHGAGLELKSRIAPPRGWRRLAKASPENTLNVSIGLKLGSFQAFERKLLEISNPTKSTYGQHLTKLQIDDFMRPSPESTKMVIEWLKQHEMHHLQLSSSQAGDWLFLSSVPVGVLEKLLQTQYHVFQNLETNATITRCLEWSIPTHIAPHVDLIEPANSFLAGQPQSLYRAPSWDAEGRLPTFDELAEEDLVDRGPLEIPTEKSLHSPPTVAEACNRLAISPLCLRALYGTYGYKVQQPLSGRSGVGILNFRGEVANRSDIQLYLERYRHEAAAAGAADEFVVERVAGGDDQQVPNTPEQMKAKKGYEGALDAQTVLGISWPLPIVTYNVGGGPPFRPMQSHAENSNEPYLAWLMYMKTKEDTEIPSVISISYADDEKSVPPEYARRVCAEFAQLGARGVTVLVATGDNGVGKGDDCVALDGITPRFMPTFPASCPYVTAVGATRFLEPEMVAFDARSNYSSAGGFSDVFDRPLYQKHAVQGYLDRFEAKERIEGMYDPNGRAFPDISAAGYHFSVMWAGHAHLQDGTSASTPTVAAIVALLNDYLAAEGRPPLGFINPWLYSAGGAAIRDVVHGWNLGCDANSSGFPALEGWDPATGLGTPVLKALVV